MNAKAYNRDALVPAKPADADSLGADARPQHRRPSDPDRPVQRGLEDARDAQVGGRDAQLRGWAAHVQRRARQPVGAVPEPPRRHPAERERPQERPPRGHPPLRRGDAGHHEPRDARGREHVRGGPQRGRSPDAHVFQTGAGTGFIGTTAAEIQTFIRDRLNNLLCIRPSYVTIMGDDDLVPTFPGISGIPSDLQYSMKNDTDELPDLAVGRIIGNDQAAVGTAVDKIISLRELAARRDRGSTRATIAAQFQDDDNDGQENRTFIQFAETVRNGLVARGVAVDRIYGEQPRQQPAEVQRRHRPARGAARSRPSAGTAPAHRCRPRGTRDASWWSTATTAGPTAGARRATARRTSRL